MSLQRQLLVICLSLLSATCIILAGMWSLQKFLIQPSHHPLLSVTHHQPNLPIAITVPHQPAILPVIPSPLAQGDWVVSTEGVSLLSTNDQELGYIFYGHNWNSLLGSLHKTQIGETIQLRYADGRVEAYQVTSSFRVAANRLDVLDLAKGDGSLLIYTCDGWLDSQRLIVLAQRNPSSVTWVTN